MSIIKDRIEDAIVEIEEIMERMQEHDVPDSAINEIQASLGNLRSAQEIIEPIDLGDDEEDSDEDYDDEEYSDEDYDVTDDDDE